MKTIISSIMLLFLVTLFSINAAAAPGDLYVQVNLDSDPIMEENPQDCAILKVGPSGILTDFISSEEIKDHTGLDAADCSNTGLAVDENGNVYFSEDESSSVLKATAGGELSTFVTEDSILALTGLTEVNLDNGMTIGMDGNLYFVDNAQNEEEFDRGSVLRATIPEGELSIVLSTEEVLDVTGKNGADLQGGIAFDCSGNLYVTDEEDDINENSDDLILKLTPGGQLSIFVTEDDILAVTGGDSTDLDVAVNFFVDNLYVLDDGDCDCVLKIDLDGNVTEFVSEAEITNVTGGPSDLEGGLAINQNETLFIGDDGSGQGEFEPDAPNILKVTQQPIVSIFVSTQELEDFYPGFRPRLEGSMAIEGVDACLIREVPTLSEWGLIAMAGILGIVGFMVIRRKKLHA